MKYLIFLFLYTDPLLNKQWHQNAAEGKEWSILTLAPSVYPASYGIPNSRTLGTIWKKKSNLVAVLLLWRHSVTNIFLNKQLKTQSGTILGIFVVYYILKLNNAKVYIIPVILYRTKVSLLYLHFQKFSFTLSIQNSK